MAPQGTRWKLTTAADVNSDERAADDVPASRSAEQGRIVEEFAFFGDWTERYQYLIDLGRKLPPFPHELKTEANKVHGCQSQVWLVAERRRRETALPTRSAIRPSCPA